MDDLMSLAEAAEELGIAPVTLRAAIARERFAARLFGKTYVTTRAEVERYRRENLGQVGRPAGVGPEPGLTKGRVDPPPGFSRWSDVKRRKGG